MSRKNSDDMKNSLLEQINCPADLKRLPSEQLPRLCQEIRDFLLESVSKTGGHLASNLGMVELTVALHRALELPQDKLIFDVGHQCYTHKLLTGRRERFDSLRKLNGLSGFPNPSESEYDTFVSGHGNTAISVAVGVAQAKKLKGEPGCVVAIVGDGAFTGGMVYEGMNNIGKLDNLIVLLNDNKMSIGKNVGSMAKYLTQLRTAPRYVQAKAGMESILDAIPVVGKSTVKTLQGIKTFVRRQVYHRSTFFEEMGFQYIGPVDGHDVEELTELIANLRREQYCPILIHASTVKGKGYPPAEENPGEFHGVSAFDRNHLTNPEMSPEESFSTCFGKSLEKLAAGDSRICAITAAMKYGTGLQYFAHTYPQRFFDVGMAEQHAITFAAGLASQGMRPVAAIYSTFLQRSYDQIIHDVNLMNLDVLLAVDRAGFVPGDGETHQGIYDPAFLAHLGIPTYSPCNYAELTYWLDWLMKEGKGPRAIRYSRGGESGELASLGCTGMEYDLLPGNGKVLLITYGTLTQEALEAQKATGVDVLKLVRIDCFSEELMRRISGYKTILFAEDCIADGGIGERLAGALTKIGWQGNYTHMAVQEHRQPAATVAQLRERNNLDAAAMIKKINEVSH